MKVTDLIPWRRKKQDAPARRNDAIGLKALQSNIDRAFEEFWRAISLPAIGIGRVGVFRGIDNTPSIDVRQNERRVDITVDLPGIDESNVDVRIANGVLIIEAEKSKESENEGNDFVQRERWYGKVSRAIPLPDGLDLDAVNAIFKNGLLTVSIPRLPNAEASAKRVHVQHE
jgi:HSP20 family protein